MKNLNLPKLISLNSSAKLNLTLEQVQNTLVIRLNSEFESDIQSLKLVYSNLLPTSQSLPLIQFNAINSQIVNIFPNGKIKKILLNNRQLNLEFDHFDHFDWIINDYKVNGIRGYFKNFNYSAAMLSHSFIAECLNYDNKKIEKLLNLIIDSDNRLIIEDINSIPVLFFNLNIIELIKNCEDYNVKSINYNYIDNSLIVVFLIKESNNVNSYKLTLNSVNILKLTKVKDNKLESIDKVKINFNSSNPLHYFSKFKLEIYLKLVKQLCNNKKEEEEEAEDEDDRDYKHSILIGDLINFIILGQFEQKFKENLQNLIKTTNLMEWSKEFCKEYLIKKNIKKFYQYLNNVEVINNYLNFKKFDYFYEELQKKLLVLINFLFGLSKKFENCINGFLLLSQEDYEGSEVLLDNLEFFEWLALDKDPYENWFSSELQPGDFPIEDMNLMSLDYHLKQCLLDWLNENTKIVEGDFKFDQIGE